MDVKVTNVGTTYVVIVVECDGTTFNVSPIEKTVEICGHKVFADRVVIDTIEFCVSKDYEASRITVTISQFCTDEDVTLVFTSEGKIVLEAGDEAD